jgi:hypothetical protein
MAGKERQAMNARALALVNGREPDEEYAGTRGRPEHIRRFGSVLVWVDSETPANCWDVVDLGDDGAAHAEFGRRVDAWSAAAAEAMAS